MSRDAIFDCEDLKDKIRRLRLEKSSLIDEKRKLEEDNAKLEENANQLRKELNVLASLEEADKFDAIDGTDDADEGRNIDVKIDLTQDRTFLEANLKLEISILAADIKKSLSSLEAEALSWEKRANDINTELKAHSSALSSLPTFLMKTPDEVYY